MKKWNMKAQLNMILFIDPSSTKECCEYYFGSDEEQEIKKLVNENLILQEVKSKYAKLKDKETKEYLGELYFQNQMQLLDTVKDIITKYRSEYNDCHINVNVDEDQLV